jgi:signal transduction histidine kinase
MSAPDDVRPDLEARWRAETALEVRSRVMLCFPVFLFFVAIADTVEALVHPERALLVAGAYASHVVTCGVALLFLRVARPQVVGVVVLGLLAAQLDAYSALIHGQADRLAVAEICLLTAVAVLIPWGPRAQTALAAVVLGAYAAASPWIVASDGIGVSMIGVVTGATTSIVGAAFLHRYRRGAFIQAARLREEADVAAALARAGELLNTHLDAPDMLGAVTRFAVETIGCDSTTTLIWDPSAGVFRLGAAHGLPEPLQASLDEAALAPSDMPSLHTLAPGELLEVTDTTAPAPGGAALGPRLGLRSALCAPIFDQGVLTGVITFGWRARVGPAPARARRLALGIAHATAIALRNGRLIADLQSASRLKSEFVATMSHELRTPLNVILGYAELLGDPQFGQLTPDQDAMVEATRRSAVQLLELVNATLGLNRLDTGHDPIDIEPIALDALFEEVDAEVRALCPVRVALRWDCEIGTLVQSDRVKLKTILKNLVGNALKFTEVGEVAVRARPDGDCLVLCVRDTGIGIPREQLPVIFEMFRQVDASATRRHGGVGLGLHIVQRLSEALGGMVGVESEPGLGSTFTVVLPGAVRGLVATGT